MRKLRGLPASPDAHATVGARRNAPKKRISASGWMGTPATFEAVLSRNGQNMPRCLNRDRDGLALCVPISSACQSLASGAHALACRSALMRAGFLSSRIAQPSGACLWQDRRYPANKTPPLTVRFPFGYASPVFDLYHAIGGVNLDACFAGRVQHAGVENDDADRAAGELKHDRAWTRCARPPKAALKLGARATGTCTNLATRR